MQVTTPGTMITFDKVPSIKRRSLNNEDARNATITIKVTQKTHAFFEQIKAAQKGRNLPLEAVLFAEQITQEGHDLRQIFEAIAEQKRLEKTLAYIIKVAQPHLNFDLFEVGSEFHNTLTPNANTPPHVEPTNA